MGIKHQISIKPLDSETSGRIEFFAPQQSDETMLVKVGAGVQEDLFVHRYQTDQLLVVSGSFVLVTLQNKQYRYTYLSEAYPQVITIPPGIPHGAVNISDKPCFVINAVQRHGEAHELDYRPIKPPMPYDFSHINTLSIPQIPQVRQFS